jgi:hypothetical protein
VKPRRWYVYHLVDPRDGAVFYVGKGTGDRVGAHESEARRGPTVTSAKCNRIRQIWSENLPVGRHIARLFEDEVEALRFEAAEIARIGLEQLTNASEGLGTRPGKILTDHICERLAFVIQRSNDLRDEVPTSEGITPLQKALLTVFDGVWWGWARHILTWAIECWGVDYCNKRFAKYGITFEFV